MVIGRVKEFDKEQVLHKAMLVFWEKGYEATSMPDLLKAMGLSRSSLYETFGDKETLYKEALQQYRRQFSRNKRALLTNATSAKTGIRQYFERHIASALDDDLPGGCFITNAAVGVVSSDDPIRKPIEESFETLEQSFYELLKKGQQTGEIDASKDIGTLSFLLLNLNHSINVVSKLYTDKKKYSDMLDHVMDML